MSLHPYGVVGFVDDERAKWKAPIGRRPLLGGLEDLLGIARRLEIQPLLFAMLDLPASRVRAILAACADLALEGPVAAPGKA